MVDQILSAQYIFKWIAGALRASIDFKQNWVSQESYLEWYDRNEEVNTSPAWWMIINPNLQRCQGQECIYQLFVKNRVVLEELICFQDTKDIIGPDKSVTNLSYNPI